MRKRMQHSPCVVLMLIVSVSIGISSHVHAKETKHLHAGEAFMASMEMHHMNMLMSHGLMMIAKGSNMAMLVEIKTASGSDEKMRQHSQHLIKEGKILVTRILNGPEMTVMMQEYAKAPLMDYTHQLGESILNVANILENLSMSDLSSPDLMAMHITINHALEMAADGANLIMLGQMGMAGDVDKLSIEHGKAALADSKSMVTEMMEMHAKGMTPAKSPVMGMSPKQAEAATRVIDLLLKMPAAYSN